ncbi:hypothetical protein [Microbacterium sp.]|uniref:hypothetical protein n=1 Tax=Microbacterium sp. TaxID=51671 RepID=UPI0039E34D90
MSRTLNVVRMQLVNRQTFIWIPLIILGGCLVISLAIYALLISSGVHGVKVGGAAQGPLWYFLAVGIQSLTLTFPFSQAMSVTRREFYLGTLLTAAVASAVLATIFVLGGLLEQATNGFGLNGYMFYLEWIWQAGPLAAGLAYFSGAMLLFVIGFACATIWKRFGAMGLTLVLIAAGAAILGILWLISRADAWGGVAAWIMTQGALGLAAWGLVATALLAGASYLILRRAIP